MVISLAARSLLVVVLLSGSRSFAVEKNEDKYQGKTPEVTRAEKSLGFWVVPPIPSPISAQNHHVEMMA